MCPPDHAHAGGVSDKIYSHTYYLQGTDTQSNAAIFEGLVVVKILRVEIANLSPSANLLNKLTVRVAFWPCACK